MKREINKFQENLKTGNWKEKWKQGDKVLMQNKLTGKTKTVAIDREGIKRGDYIQPNEKDAFIKKYGWHPDENKQTVEKYLNKKGIKLNGN